MQIEELEKITSIFVNFTLIAAAVVAVIKLQLYKLLVRRYRTDFRATHTSLNDGKILFEGDYVVHNTGELPIKLTKVDLGLYGVRYDKGRVEIDKENTLFRKEYPDKIDLGGLFHIQAGERAIFPIRCELSHLDEVTYVCCLFEWPYKRKPGPYISLYVKSRGETFVAQVSKS